MKPTKQQIESRLDHLVHGVLKEYKEFLDIGELTEFSEWAESHPDKLCDYAVAPGLALCVWATNRLDTALTMAPGVARRAAQSYDKQMNLFQGRR